MEKNVCLRCGGHMSFVGREQLQKGKMGFFLGEWPNLLAGAYEVEVYVCDRCRKMESYAAEEPESLEEPEDMGAMKKVACPHCGTMHELDDAVCPYCGKRLQELDSPDVFNGNF